MQCLICNSSTNHFLTKNEFHPAYRNMVENFGSFEYLKCSSCGFVFSKTHLEMNLVDWNKLNYEFHHYIENNDAPLNQPPYLQQALMINTLQLSGLVDISKGIDFAGGYGTLSKILNQFFQIKLSVYDPFVQQANNAIQYIKSPDLEGYSCVINSALFEHVTSRDSLDEINSLVSKDGSMVLHTVICENIPDDQNWFYFQPPVHCAFHTNQSMSFLMKQWHFESSIYCPAAKSWVLLKKDSSSISHTLSELNKLFQTDYFYYKKGFLDYWKGF